MKNKLLQEMLAKYPEDADIFISEKHPEISACKASPTHQFIHIEEDNELWLVLDEYIFSKHWFGTKHV